MLRCRQIYCTNVNICSAKEVGWKCTLCTGDYDSSLENNSIVAISYIREYEQNILERILMELYCQNNESEHFRELLDKNDVRLTVDVQLVLKLSTYIIERCILFICFSIHNITKQ